MQLCNQKAMDKVVLPTQKFKVAIPKLKVAFTEKMSEYSKETSQFLKKDSNRDNHYNALLKALLVIFNQFDNHTARYIRASIVANNIEEAIFDECETNIKFKHVSRLSRYLNRCLTVIRNLNMSTNPNIPKGLYYHTISATKLLSMKSYEYLNKEGQAIYLHGSRKVSTVDYSVNLCLNKDDEATIDDR